MGSWEREWAFRVYKTEGTGSRLCAGATRNGRRYGGLDPGVISCLAMEFGLSPAEGLGDRMVAIRASLIGRVAL